MFYLVDREVAGVECLLLTYTDILAKRKEAAEASHQDWCFAACQFTY